MGANMRFRVLVLGGYGTFGERICRTLSADSTIRVIVAGRDGARASRLAVRLQEGYPGCGAEYLACDAGHSRLGWLLAMQRIDAVINTAGPFQGQDYRVARACISAGSHYIDLADARDYVCGFTALDSMAREHGVLAITGASSVPALSAAVVDVLSSGEFCSARRRVAHLLTMYGFVLYVITTAVMVFGYPTPATPAPAMLPLLWWVGGLMVCVGGYWFWFFIRVDVAAEGNSPLRIVRADLFVLSLLSSVTLGLIWAYLQASASSGASVLFGLYIIATTILFAGIPWSKFAHMFFKPAAAFEKRVSDANGTRSNLPAPSGRPEQFGRAREQPRHY